MSGGVARVGGRSGWSGGGRRAGGGWTSCSVNDPGPDLRVMLSPLVTSARCGRHRPGL